MKMGRVTLGTMLVAMSLAGSAWAVEPGKDEAQPKWKGSIKVSGTHTETELAKMAKISESDAKKIALRSIVQKDVDKEVLECELEVEDGFLIYSVSIKLKGKEGVEELLVDAGTGKVLSHEHEADDPEADEEGQQAGDDPDADSDDHGDGEDGD